MVTRISESVSFQPDWQTVTGISGVPPQGREVAMSINLNTEEFEGGELRFPEFGDQRYRPDTGTAIVFSSSLLHEAMHVTAGRRMVFLAFLFGDR